MKQVPIKLGPVALLLTVITICLTVMAILTFSTANADRSMADMFASSTQIRYALEQEGQKFLQEADEALAEGKSLTDLPGTKTYEGGPDGSVEKVIEKDGYHLTVRLEPEEMNTCRVAAWSLDKEWKENQQINVWQGF